VPPKTKKRKSGNSTEKRPSEDKRQRRWHLQAKESGLRRNYPASPLFFSLVILGFEPKTFLGRCFTLWSFFYFSLFFT
jgi:hypothetical protein